MQSFKRSTTLPNLQKNGTTPSNVPKPSYGYWRDRIVRITPDGYQCKLFCNGLRCKYCNGTFWGAEQQAITGLYSSWITDDILAMARPTTSTVENCNIVKQFINAGITSIVNLQHVGEHAHCGPPLHSCGFSYNPEEFMRYEIFHYNFGWPDFGVSTLPNMLDMIKVLSFSLNQGKTAIHCHAGLGRTGALICCYLIWDRDMQPVDAIELVRSKRPNSVQNKQQIQLVYDFAEFLRPLKTVQRHDLDLTAYLSQQQLVLHGVEARILRHIPKIAYVICERLLELAGVQYDGTLPKKLELLSFGDEIFYEQIVARHGGNFSSSPDKASLSSSSTDDGFAQSYNGTLGSIQRLSEQMGLPALPMRRPSFYAQKSQDKHDTSANVGGLPRLGVGLPPLNKPENRESLWRERQTWRNVLKQCLMRYTQNQLNTPVTDISESLRHSPDGWSRVCSEEDALPLAILLGQWFRGLKKPAVTSAVLLPHAMGGGGKLLPTTPPVNLQTMHKDDRPPTKMTASQKWTILYLSNVFAQLSGPDDVARKDSAVLLCDWLTWSRDHDTELYFQSCIDTVSPSAKGESL